MPMFFPTDDVDRCTSDEEFVQWVRSGDRANCAKAVAALFTHERFMSILRRRILRKLEQRQMLPDQAFHYRDGEYEALSWIFERALSVESLPVTLERGKGFDPLLGTLMSWLLTQADYRLRDWLKKDDNSSDPREFAAQDTIEGWDAATPASDVIKDYLESYLLKASLREMIAKLPSMRRACMIVKYLGDPEDVDASSSVMKDDDWECLWRVQSKQKTKQATEQQLDALREQLSQLWTVVAARSPGSANLGSIEQRNCENNISRLLGKLLIQQSKLDYYRKRLLGQGIADDELDELAEQATGMTLQEISESFPNRRTDERSLMECSRQSWRTAQQLDKARQALERSAEIKLPTPLEIAVLLNSTVNAVSSALCRAHTDIAEVVGKLNDARCRENPS